MGPAQLAEVLGRLPRSANPSLLVGFETSDDAGVFLLPGGQALVQTMDFFTPIVDDPYAYGQIAAANALSDVYAMGGTPVTVMNIACFDPSLAPADVWAEVFRGLHDKTVESGATLVGGHSVIDAEPKFGLSVTGVVDPERAWRNDRAKVGDQIWLSKPLGTGIVTTAAKNDAASPEELQAAIQSMAMLNKAACEEAMAIGDVQCATDVTGFGLVGHLSHISRASQVRIEIDSASLPVLPGVEAMVEEGHVTAGGGRNRDFVGQRLTVDTSVPRWLVHLASDPQTSGGLAVFSQRPVSGSTLIGRVSEGSPAILLS
ncbi:MAG: selenide, water dikinase SelD [Armatimonadetes bacterium]|nr:selenide, water dikinase SelD [Armatimonadota bacterium]